MNFNLSAINMESQFLNNSDTDRDSDLNLNDIVEDASDEQFQMFMRFIISSSIMLISTFSILIIVRIIKPGQKTRNPQQRRHYTGNGRRPSLTQTEPTIYVSPANLPPPPKYEAMAPPSYEEVVGIHYPGYRPPVQPITQPIAVAMAQNSTEIPNNSSHSSSNDDVTPPATVIRVTSDSRTSVTVATS